MEIQIETLRAQCADFEQNVVDINELFQKERDEHGTYLLLLVRVWNVHFKIKFVHVQCIQNELLI